jgi:hypothetical protein
VEKIHGFTSCKNQPQRQKRLEEAEKSFVLITGALSIEKNIS